MPEIYVMKSMGQISAWKININKFVTDEYNYDNVDFLNNSNTQTFTHDYFE